MARFCTACGKNIPDGVAFCTECGAKVSANSNAEIKEVKQVQPQDTQPQERPVYSQPQPTYQQVPQQAAPPTNAERSGGVVSTGAFFGMMLLFALPMIGFIACIIMCFLPKNQNLKNYAKANLIWAIIGFVFGVLLIVGVIILGNSILNYINEAFNS